MQAICHPTSLSTAIERWPTNMANLNPKTSSDQVMRTDKISVEESLVLLESFKNKIVMLPYASAQPYSVSKDTAIAYVRYNVGAAYKNYTALIQVFKQPGTPYTAVSNHSVGSVDESGYLEVEFYGAGFVIQHVFTINIILIKG